MSSKLGGIAPAGNGQKMEQARVSTPPPDHGEEGSGPNKFTVPANQPTDPIFAGGSSFVGERPLADKSGVVIPDQKTGASLPISSDLIGKIEEAIRARNVSEDTILLLIKHIKETQEISESFSMKEILDLFFKIQEAGLAPDALATTDGDGRSIFSYIFENLKHCVQNEDRGEFTIRVLDMLQRINCKDSKGQLLPFVISHGGGRSIFADIFDNLELMLDEHRGQIAIRVLGMLEHIGSKGSNGEFSQILFLKEMFAEAGFLIPRLILNNLEYVETQEDRKDILRRIIDVIEKLNPDARRTILTRINFDGKFFKERQFLHYLVALGDYERRIVGPWLDPIIKDSSFLLSLLDKIASFEPKSLGKKIKSLGGETVFTYKPLGGRGFINTGKFWEINEFSKSEFPNLAKCVSPEHSDNDKMRRKAAMFF